MGRRIGMTAFKLIRQKISLNSLTPRIKTPELCEVTARTRDWVTANRPSAKDN